VLKFLPILLFAFLIADESTMYLTTEGWEKSDKLKDILKELKPEMDKFNDKLSSLLHPDKFLIKNAFKIIDTTRIENSSNDSLMSKITILENRYFEGLDSLMIFSFYKLSDSGDYYEILTTWYAIEVNVDNSIELDNQTQDMVWMALETATGLEKEFDPDLLIFNSVDFSKHKQQAGRNTSNPIYMKNLIDNTYIYPFSSSELKQIILDNILYNEDKQDIRLKRLRRLIIEGINEELESVINTNSLFIDVYHESFGFDFNSINQDAGLFTFNLQTDNIIDSLVYNIIAVVEADEDGGEIPSGVFISVMTDLEKETINSLKNSFSNYQNRNPKLNKIESYNNFIDEHNILNSKDEVSSSIINAYIVEIGIRIFTIYVDKSFTSKKQNIIKNIIVSMYPEMEDCGKNMEYIIDGCIEFITTDIDSLKRAKEIEKGIASLSREKIYDNSLAVIIGIDKYDNLSNLDYAVADAEAVKDMLINKFSYDEENVKLLINEDANKVNIEQAISDVSLEAGENDRILVFFAGHGETMSLPDGGEMGYLLPVDGRQENLYASAIPMNDLKDLSNMSKAKHMLFLIDACYGGLAAVGTRGLEPAKTPNYLEKITNIKARQIITAGGSDEKVIEKPEWGHSAYTMNLLRALKDGLADTNGDGYITASELGLYLNEKVTIDSENQQTPQSRRLTSHEGEFIFFIH